MKQIWWDWCEIQDGSLHLLDYKQKLWPFSHKINTFSISFQLEQHNHSIWKTLRTTLMNVSTDSAPWTTRKKDRKKDKFTSTPTTKKWRQSDSVHSSPDKSCCTEVSDILTSIDNKLSGLDVRISLVEVLHKEFQQLRESLEFSKEQILIRTEENKSLQHSVTSVSTQPLQKKTRTWKKPYSIYNHAAWEVTLFFPVSLSQHMTTIQNSWYRNSWLLISKSPRTQWRTLHSTEYTA